MAHIIIETHGNGTRVEIHGKAKDLTEILVDAVLNDPHFGILVFTAIAAISEDKTKLPDINLN